LRVGCDKTTGEGARLDPADAPATGGEAVAGHGDDLGDRGGILGGYVEVLAEAVDQTVGLDRITACDHQGLRATDRDTKTCRDKLSAEQHNALRELGIEWA
jgi:hypothetical protein